MTAARSQTSEYQHWETSKNTAKIQCTTPAPPKEGNLGILLHKKKRIKKHPLRVAKLSNSPPSEGGPKGGVVAGWDKMYF